MVFGLMPSVRLSRTGSQQLIKENPNGSGVARSQLRSGFAVTQIAVSLVILISAGLTAKSFARLIDVDPGFDPNNVLTMETWLPWPNIPENVIVKGAGSVGITGAMGAVDRITGTAGELLEHLQDEQ